MYGVQPQTSSNLDFRSFLFLWNRKEKTIRMKDSKRERKRGKKEKVLKKLDVRGSLNKFPDFFRMGTFIESTHMKL